MKTKKIFSILMGVVLLAGCSESWLELSNPNLQTTETFWKTDDDFRKGVNATYQSLAIYDGTFLRFAPLALDLRGDDCWSPSPWDVLSNTGSFKLANSSIMQEWLWVAFYGVVNRANQVVVNIDGITFTDPDKQKQYKGEALFLRGLANFYLVTFFDNVPLILRPYEKEDDFFPTQATPEQTWAQVMADFEAAADLLPVAYSADDLGRATRGAALAYLAKARLFNGEYASAAEALKAVIDLNQYNLMSNYGDNFTEEFENNEESVFEVQFDRGVGGTILGWVGAPQAGWSLTTARAITYAPTPFGWGDVAPTKWLYDEFLLEKTTGVQDDPRMKATIHYNYAGCTLYGQSFQTVYAAELNKLAVRKYCNDQSGRVDEKDWRSGVNERLMRYADVLLMYAECQNELNNPALCAQYLQQVRDRAQLPDQESAFAALSKEAMREVIAHERALEFALEGHRFDDIRRWGWLQDSEKLAQLKKNDTEFLNYVNGREFFSIPQEEIEKNANLRQNTGY